MKLKPIKTGIAVHTPTKEEANELLAILHVNGYKWKSSNSLVEETYWGCHKDKTTYAIRKDKRVEFGDCPYFKNIGLRVLSLAEFKRMYCEEDKPQPKFKVDDCVSIRWINKWGRIIGLRFHEEAQEWEYNIKVYPKGYATAFESNLSPYTEPETKEK